MLSAPPLGELVNTCAGCVAVALQRREIFLAAAARAGGLDPVVHERRLHLRDRRAFDAVVRVAPVLGILRVALPLVGDADAAGEADRPSTTSSLR